MKSIFETVSTVILVAAGEMHRLGIPFYLTPNGVWLVDSIPAQFLRFDDLRHA